MPFYIPFYVPFYMSFYRDPPVGIPKDILDLAIKVADLKGRIDDLEKILTSKMQ